MCRRNGLILYVAVFLVLVTSDVIADASSPFGSFGISPVDLIKSFVDVNLDKIKAVTESNRANDTNSVECYNGFINLRNGIERSEMWAFKVLDSWSKLQSGLLMGNLIDQGNYDECLAVNEVRGNKTIFQGQYCIMPLAPNSNVSTFDYKSTSVDPKYMSRISFGATYCIPATCSPNLWAKILNELLNGYAHVDDDQWANNVEWACDKVGNKSKLSAFDWFGIGFFSLTGVLMIISTIYDYTADEPIKILTAFSLYSNGKDIFSLKTSKSKYNIQCLHGIRALGIIGVIFAHSYMIQMQIPAINKTVYLSWFEQLDKILLIFVILHSTHLFFFLSGFLIGWINFKYLDKLNDKTGLKLVPHMYFQRYLRLTPAFAATILLIITLFRFFGDGPGFNMVSDVYADHCQKSWWSSLLYVQNIIHPSWQCPGFGGWYLSADTQLFFLSPLIFVPLWKFGKKALALPIAIFCVTLSWTSYRVYDRNFGFLELTNQDKRYEYLEYVFYRIHHRSGSWLIGIILSKLMYDWRDKKFNLSKFYFNKIMWAISFLFALGMYWTMYKICSKQISLSMIATVIHYILYHYFMILIVAWIVFASYYGYGGIINSILSWKIWLPISRLTYCMFLSHSIIILTAQLRGHTPIYIDTFLDFKTAAQGLFLTFLVSILYKIAFESSYGHILNSITRVDKLKKKFAGDENKNEDELDNTLPLADNAEKRNKIYFNK